MSVAIAVDAVSKRYRRMAPGFRLRTLKSALVDRSLVGDLGPEDAIPALSDVAFEVVEGEAIGVIGGNGSGKSTLLKLVAGILRPDRGEVRIQGRVAALIELGAGFHPEISGRENVYINGAVLGLTRREIDRRFASIVEFAGLEGFIDEPVKSYSSGMYVRLGFAVAIHTDPDVLLVDEVLSVGDEAFSHKCRRRIEEFLADGRTLLFVSHDLQMVEDLCDRVVWLEGGRCRLVGDPRRVVDAYRQSVAESEGRAHQREKDAEVDEPGDDREVLRWGSGRAVLEGVRLLVDGEERYHLRSGEPLTIELEVQARDEISDFVFGVAVSTPRGIECWGTNSDLAGAEPSRLEGRATVTVEVPELQLAAGEYLLDAAVHAKDGAPYDYRRKILAFTVTGAPEAAGLYAPRHRWGSRGGVEWRHPPGGD